MFHRPTPTAMMRTTTQKIALAFSHHCLTCSHQCRMVGPLCGCEDPLTPSPPLPPGERGSRSALVDVALFLLCVSRALHPAGEGFSPLSAFLRRIVQPSQDVGDLLGGSLLSQVSSQHRLGLTQPP